MNIFDYPHSELLRITRAYYVSDFIIEVEFNNGEVHQIDFYPLIFGNNKKAYKLLQDIDFFRNFVPFRILCISRLFAVPPGTIRGNSKKI